MRGVPSTFVIDSGCAGYAVVSRKQVEAWGLAHKVVRSSRSNCDVAPLSLTHNGVRINVRAQVIADTDANLLGHEDLAQRCCVLDLDPSRPTLIFQQTACRPHLPQHKDIPKVPVTVAGRELMAVPDTGCSEFVISPPAVVQALPVHLEEYGRVKSLSLVEGIGRVTHHAKAVEVSAFGLCKLGSVMAFDVGHGETLLGMKYLSGARFEYQFDRTVSIAFPERLVD